MAQMREKLRARLQRQLRLQHGFVQLLAVFRLLRHVAREADHRVVQAARERELDPAPAFVRVQILIADGRGFFLIEEFAQALAELVGMLRVDAVKQRIALLRLRRAAGHLLPVVGKPHRAGIGMNDRHRLRAVRQQDVQQVVIAQARFAHRLARREILRGRGPPLTRFPCEIMHKFVPENPIHVVQALTLHVS
jgi:hypothetical protein